MSVRARNARLLASMLTRRSSVDVRVYYDRKIRRYRVVWTGGPEATYLYRVAVTCADQVPELDISTLLWDRQ
nr:hypothetical protein [Kibdelosporangium sp. MJ126-NF4]